MAAIANTTTGAQHENAELAADQVQVANSFAKMISALDPAPTAGRELAALIEAHRDAYIAFEEASDAEEVASVARMAAHRDQLYKGPFATSYEMRMGEDWVKDQISTEIAWYREKMKIFKKIDPTLHESLLASLNQCEKDHLVAIEVQFADANAAYSLVKARYNESNRMELDTLLAVCAFPCGSPAELRIKGDYLAAVHSRSGMMDEHFEALIESMKTAT
ncbi:hypothetical protein G6M87_10475 [Rhizobium rhizogenes]|uniref:hypothetical protein n=1 Tax=Rhizobium rhizogenes TaxID=359 RepID=UPI001571BDD3|nr:hypothetical protein [Rhizobium rhizogenes]NTI22281.1 hypothetical protein [Rhizobium rhizogenes]QTG05871.1 hypothetical protein G6M87_10475 [Rhizobium rhizogenes]